MRIFPTGRRQWLYLGLRLALIGSSLASAAWYATAMPGCSYSGQLHQLTADEELIRNNLKAAVWTLAGEIGPRNSSHAGGLRTAAQFIRKTLDRAEYSSLNGVPGTIEAVRLGAASPGENIIIGAHYDSAEGTAGANDNASGVAALLELDRLLSGRRLARTLRFVAFAREEPPYFQTEQMGSRAYAKELKQSNSNVTAMLSLETIGSYRDSPGSQRYPFPFRSLYPSQGNFIAFIGNVASRSLTRQAIQSFRSSTDFPSEGIAAPGWLNALGWSDHWSFWTEGYRAIMVTDTALFRYDDYHRASDTPDKLDYDRMARVVAGLATVVEELANRKGD